MFEFNKAEAYKSLCVYGPPVTGKTEMVVSLLKAGHVVWYIDLDRNTAPFEAASPEVLKNLRYLRISDNHVTGNIVTSLNALKVGKLVVCQDHGVFQCPVCKKAEPPRPMLEFNLGMMGRGDILVLDSFSVVHGSVLRKVLAHNSITPEDMQRMETTFYAAVANLTAPIWELFCKPPQPVNTIILTHTKNKAPTLIKDPPPPYYVPNAGSVNFSAESAGRLLGALWYTRVGQPPMYGSSRTERFDAFTRSVDPELFKGKSLGEAAVMYFASTRAAPAPK